MLILQELVEKILNKKFVFFVLFLGTLKPRFNESEETKATLILSK
jgi:hypothetical protein